MLALWAGRRTPVGDIAATLEARRPIHLVAASVSIASNDPARLGRQAEALATAARAAGADLVLGGRGAWPDRPSHGVRLQDFASFHQHLSK